MDIISHYLVFYLNKVFRFPSNPAENVQKPALAWWGVRHLSQGLPRQEGEGACDPHDLRGSCRLLWRDRTSARTTPAPSRPAPGGLSAAMQASDPGAALDSSSAPTQGASSSVELVGTPLSSTAPLTRLERPTRGGYLALAIHPLHDDTMQGLSSSPTLPNIQ